MISSNNVLKPSDGRPVAEPSQDMVLGSLLPHQAAAGLRGGAAQGRRRRRPRRPRRGCGRTPSTSAALAEIEMALLNGSDHATTRAIWFWYVPPREARRMPQPRWLRTTVGRVLFNSILPRRVVAELGFRDDLMKKKDLSELVLQSYRRAGLARDGHVPRPAQGLRLPLRHHGRRVDRHRGPGDPGREGRAPGRGRRAGQAVPAGLQHRPDHLRRAVQQGDRRLDPRQQRRGRGDGQLDARSRAAGSTRCS